MSQTGDSIANMARIFARYSSLPEPTFVQSLESLVRVAISEHIAKEALENQRIYELAIRKAKQT